MSVKIFNQKGFTLPEVLVAAALLGGVALITAKLMGDQAAQQAYVIAQSEVAKSVSEVENYLNNPVTCRDFLKGKNIGTDVSPFVLTLPTPPGGTRTILQPGNYNQYTIEPGGITLQTSTVGRSVADVTIVFRLNNKSIKQRRDADGYVRIVKRIPVIVQLPSTGGTLVDDCGPVLDENLDDVAKRKMCDAIIAGEPAGQALVEWDAGSGVGQGTCRLRRNARCPFGQVATKVTSLGGIICTNIQDQIRPSEYFDLGSTCSGTVTSATQISLVRDPGTNKLKIQCTP